MQIALVVRTAYLPQGRVYLCCRAEYRRILIVLNQVFYLDMYYLLTHIGLGDYYYYYFPTFARSIRPMVTKSRQETA